MYYLRGIIIQLLKNKVMEDLNLKSFCLVIIGKHVDIKDELGFISEGPINFIDGEDIFIATFKSILYAKDIENLLNDKNINFIISEMIPTLFSMNLGIFNDKLFIHNINENINDCNGVESLLEFDILENEIVDEGREELTLDDILDKISKIGFNKLTEYEKERLSQLSNKI
jgi:hypothetical protein